MLLNPANAGFADSLRSDIYVDKSGLIAYTNRVIKTKQKYVCVSRPRRFGKTMAVEMLTAYYSRGCDSAEMFGNLKIACDPSFKKNLNKYDVIFLNMQSFLSGAGDAREMLKRLSEKLLTDLIDANPGVKYFDRSALADSLEDIHYATGTQFIFIIDEWDCVLRAYKENKQTHEEYLDYLRNLLKDRTYVALAYMTGILPIKKYGTHSALNMFDEFSMTAPGPFAEYTGFTKEEVSALCVKYQMDSAEIAHWYDGYRCGDVSAVYNPKSVVTAILLRKPGNYWSVTETYEALRIYIDMNFDGVKDTIIRLMADEKKEVDTRSFINDMSTFQSYDDVLTLLIHLGYLGYMEETHEVFIPNKEIFDEFVTAVRSIGWNEIITAIKSSDKLLQATWRGDQKEVAKYIENAHNDTSHLTYNDENALAYTISLAYYSAREYYTVIREMPSGKGFADLVFLPRKNHPDKPAMVVELKWNKSAAGALKQIKERGYTDALRDYKGSILLVGVNYSKKTKRHSCVIT
ncbi:MAG: ATP-binding protein [Clostridiales bacterium]|nr:ATP-binding protein [Clostridiales bacterium]